MAVGPDGAVWCGGEAGQLFRIAPDGTTCEQVASTGGFVLGIAFGPCGDLFACDMLHRAVFRLPAGAAEPELFCAGAPSRPFVLPNALAVDGDGSLFVSDSHERGRPAPGLFRVAPDGRASLWSSEPLDFANGVAIAPDRSAVYVVESFLPGIARIPLRDDGTAGAREEFVRLAATIPDGLAFGPDDRLYVGCYEPSQVLRIAGDRTVETVLRDATAHLLCHPTSVAFRESTLFTANLGRWHITAVEDAVA